MSPIFWGMRNTSNASICSVCEHPSSSSTCLLCDSIINTNKTQQWGCQVSQGSHDEAIKMLGPGNKSAQKRWKSIAQITSQSKDVQWARLSDISKDPVLCSPCTDEELGRNKVSNFKRSEALKSSKATIADRLSTRGGCACFNCRRKDDDQWEVLFRLKFRFSRFSIYFLQKNRELVGIWKNYSSLLAQ